MIFAIRLNGLWRELPARSGIFSFKKLFLSNFLNSKNIYL